MPLLDQEARDQISELFGTLEAQVRLVFFTRKSSKLIVPGQDQEVCPTCDEEWLRPQPRRPQHRRGQGWRSTSTTGPATA